MDQRNSAPEEAPDSSSEENSQDEVDRRRQKQRLKKFYAVSSVAICIGLLALVVLKQSKSDDSASPTPQPVASPAQLQAAIDQAEAQSHQGNQTPVSTGASNTLQVGDDPIPFVLDGSGGQVSLSDLTRHHQPAAIEFIATWCPHCRKMAPRFARVMRDHPEVSYVVVDAANESLNKLRNWHQNFLSRPMPGEFAVDPGQSITRAYGVVGTPTVVFIGAAGTVAEVYAGELSKHQLEDKVSSLSK